MNVERVDLMRVIHDAPVVKCADGYGLHRRIQWTIFLAIDVKALLVFREADDKVRRAILNSCYELGW